MKKQATERTFDVLEMKEFPLRSPAAKVGGIVYIGRMLDKIREHAKGELPPAYQPNLGVAFDRTCAVFLKIHYDELVERVKSGGTDEEILAWCFGKGRRPTDDEIHIWNDFMRKRGWKDSASEKLAHRKEEAGFADRPEIDTMFAFIDADEGRA